MAKLIIPGESLLAEFGLLNPQLERIRAGRNSRVWRVEGLGCTYILKQYFRHSGDPRDRLATEYGFLSFLNSQGLTNVPQPLAQDAANGFALYSYIPGVPVTTIETNHIQQSAHFIEQINQNRYSVAARSLPSASESCFSLEEHLQRVKWRLESLQIALVNRTDPSQLGAYQLLAEHLWPTYKKLEQQLQFQYSAVDLSKTLDFQQRVLSPSDFGFHNILEVENQLHFLDFEYAGWDDPAKLLCDFASQPQCPVSVNQSKVFGNQLSVWLPQIQERASLLLPLYRLKWCCILLNEFRDQDRQRRYHAGDDQTDHLEVQLHKAQTYFCQHLPNY
ncbi:aminoglycoside phosphotransferase family protein [Spirulina major]|uniref:aminoglycoside phosphotransferase family protein n=1 Tax=Spirulina major TaxID=270636 RepID=UPI000A00DDEC|nr:aminoglycoside phosphotransferase family protein [Spirulina major]